MNEFIWYCYKMGYQIDAPPLVFSREELRLEERPAEPDRFDDCWIRPVKSSTRSTKAWRRYAPLRDDSALFFTFADLEFERNSVVDFASRFGLLTDPEKGEPLATWRAAIADMRSEEHTSELQSPCNLV